MSFTGDNDAGSTENGLSVYKVIGAPGTGKTTRVVGNPELPDVTSLVMENLEQYDFEDQMIVTYTNAGVDEAADRLHAILDTPKYVIEDRVTTIHGQCYRLLGLDREQVVQHWDKRQFCDKMDLDFGYDDDADDIMAADKQEGNAFFDIFSWLQSNRKGIEEVGDCPQDWTGDRPFRHYAEQWLHYKHERNLVDFPDMIERVVSQGRQHLEANGLGVLFPEDDTTDREMFEAAREDPDLDPEALRGRGKWVDTKVLYVDEVQDLTPLQWDWYLMQKLVCQKTYIGGDDDQTIYGWAGANPNFMLDEEGDFEVLDRTYRIPRKIWETCDGVIQQVDKRQPKEVTPHGEGGEVVTLHRPSPNQVLEHAREGSVFILFRARYMINDFTDELHQAGIPYTNMSTFETWEKDIITLRDALAKCANGKEHISGDELQVMMDYADDEIINDKDAFSPHDRAMANLAGVKREKVEQMFKNPRLGMGSAITPKGFLDHCEEVNYYQQQAIVGNIKRGLEDLSPERVRIGTIHSAKGKEAETVILSLDSTKTILQNMAEDTMDQPDKRISDAERRVYYVGMTRASQKLVLAEGMIDPETSIQLKDLLDGYEPDVETASLGSERLRR